MTDEHDPTIAYALIQRKTNPYALEAQLAPVDWKEMRERFNPQGQEIPAKELIGRTFTILELRPINSSYKEGDIFFYIKGVLAPDGELFHSSLGGQAVVEILSDFHALNTAWQLAKETNDVERLAELETVGAGRPIVLTLGWKAQGAYSGYYTLE